MRIGVLHGPNLNLLGTREPGIYGAITLHELDASLTSLGETLGASVSCFQANAESELVQRIQETGVETDGYLVNAAAYTHTSIALRDALLAVGRPFVEVHLSNVHAREPFRHRSYLSDRAVGVVVGFGPDSYLLGLRGLVGFLRTRDPNPIR